MTASSIGCWFASSSNARVAIRGIGILPASEVSAVPACGPDTRTMEMALGGRPDDSAKMVCSRGCIAYLFQSPLKRQRNFRLTESWGRTGGQGAENAVMAAAIFAAF